MRPRERNRAAGRRGRADLDQQSGAWQPLQLGCVERSSPEAAERCAEGAGLDGDEACQATIAAAVASWPLPSSRHTTDRVLVFASIHSTPSQGSRFCTRSALDRLRTGFEGPVLRSYGALSGIRSAGRYAQSSEPRPCGTSFPQRGTYRAAKMLMLPLRSRATN
jgi:hypothetical protein